MYRLRLLGGAALEGAAGPLTGRAVQRRRLALLALLAAAPKQTLTRDKVISALWPESDTDNARHLLSDSLYILNKELGKDALRVIGDDIRLNTQVIWTDVVAFRELLQADQLDAAVALYDGPFLDGVFLQDAPEFERWSQIERDRLAREYARALEDLAEAAVRAGDARAAVDWWRQRAALDPLDSRTALALMRALVAADDRAAALQHARLHTTLLREELSLPPPEEMERLSEQLRVVARVASRPLPEAVLQEPPSDVSALTAPPALHSTADKNAGHSRQLIAAVLLLLLIGGGTFWRRRAATASLPTRTVVLAQVEGTDSTLSLAVKEALRAELEATPNVRLVSEDAMRETMRLMRMPLNTAAVTAIAVDVARRRGAPLVIGGSVTRVGAGTQIVAQLIETPSGDIVATFTERPRNDDEVLGAVARMAQSIRARALSIPIDTLPSLPAVSTASLDALQYYVRARQAAARNDAAGAAELAEAALVHDSLFALAHYLAADQLWYIDQQRHSTQHMVRAYELSAQLPPREQLMVRARYEQLVRDEPDSAIVRWKLLARSFPDEAIAYEGLRWAYRALGELDLMAMAAESAYVRDPTKPSRYIGDRIDAHLRHGDTVSAFRLADEFGLQRMARGAWAMHQRRWADAEQLVGGGVHHFVLLALGRVEEAYAQLDQLRRARRAQDLPRALLLQARVDLETPRSRGRARAMLEEVLAWLENADLSPPTYARYAERIAETAARLGDGKAIDRAQRVIREQDGGRNLRSYRMALTTIAAARAYQRGDMVAAAGLAAQSWPGMFYGRSVATVALLEADARAAVGERAAADSLYRTLIAGSFIDGDGETQTILQQFAKTRLTRD